MRNISTENPDLERLCEPSELRRVLAEAGVSVLHRRCTKVPNLNVAGWWDQEDFYGPMKVYELLEKNDPNNLNYLVVGPWNHGGWRQMDGRSSAKFPFDSNTSKYFRRDIEAPWFAYWLKDKGSKDFAEATVFQTGSNRWERYDSWPPKSAKPTALYMRAE